MIRPYRAEDRAAVTAVFYHAVRTGTAAFYTEPQRAAWAPSPEPDLTKPDKLIAQWCLVNDEDGRITGFMSMDHGGYLDMAFVLPEVMGKGVAAALYDGLMPIARAAGLRRFTVRAAHQSQRFLSRRGWIIDRSAPHASDGQIYDVFHMSLTDPDA